MSDERKRKAIHTAAEAIRPFRDETDRIELLWRVAQVLELPKDLRPCCPCDDAPCIHQGKPCECWACTKLFRAGGKLVVRDVPRCSVAGCSMAARHGPGDVAMVCWSHAGDWPEVSR
jgi:hypothetical protein